jgi:GxxExxY protein
MSENVLDALTEKVIGCAYTVHNDLGAGFFEKVYENALAIELKSHGIEAKRQVPVHVKYKGEVVGDYFADIVANDLLVLELKAVQTLSKAHEVQLVNYLCATGKDIGLLIDFGESVQVRRKYRVYRPNK